MCQNKPNVEALSETAIRITVTLLWRMAINDNGFKSIQWFYKESKIIMTT